MENDIETAEQTELVLDNNDFKEEKRNALLSSIASCKMDTIDERVAFLLNHFPETRNSDITLQLKYWEEYEGEIFDGEFIARKDLYQLTRLTTLARSRAKIQNQYLLFQADSDVKRQRGKLSDEEKTKAREKRPDCPIFVIYADESGKTENNIIVGSIWFLDPKVTASLTGKILTWKEENSFKDELHFVNISSSNFPKYYAFADFIANQTAMISFKAISIARQGLKSIQETLDWLYYFLLIKGVEHENESGRAPLPRLLQMLKDQEEKGADALFIAKLDDQMRQCAATRFNKMLYIDEFLVVDSKSAPLMQLTDLFVSSLNRVINHWGAGNKPKDVFAKHFLSRLGVLESFLNSTNIDDVLCHIAL